MSVELPQNIAGCLGNLSGQGFNDPDAFLTLKYSSGIRNRH
jgi:hypothetical protein